jgi:hypothetical protein
LISDNNLFISSFLGGSKPRALIATLSSFISIIPLPSVSNKSKASRISCCCSIVRPEFVFCFFLRVEVGF